MSKKFWALALCVVLALSLLAGCSNNSSSTPAPANDGGNSTPANDGGNASGAAGSVYWLNMKPESDEVLQKVAEMYTAETGVPVKVVTAASGTYDQQLTAEMDKSALMKYVGKFLGVI